MIEKFDQNKNFIIEKSINSLKSLIESDVLITDYSGVSIEYILALKKPVIFVNSAKKINNHEHEKIKLSSIENELRNNFGYQINTDNLNDIVDLIKTIEKSEVTKEDDINKFISKNFYNFGKSAEKIADQIFNFL